MTAISVPVLVKYRMPRRNYDLFFKLGIMNNIILDSETRLVSEELVGNTVYTTEESSFPILFNHEFEISKYQQGFMAGVSIVKSMKNMDGGLSLNFAHMPPRLFRTAGLTATTEYITLSITILK